MKNQAFTLIELLVVVLIIGILAAIAVPQYQKAVEKSKAVQAISIMKSFAQAIRVYYLANGKLPESFEVLDVSLDGWTGNTRWYYDLRTPTISNGDWSLQIYKTTIGNMNLYCGRISGKYKGGGFYMPAQMTTSLDQDDKIYCVERRSGGIVLKGDPGDYCMKIFNAKEAKIGVNTYDSYNMP